MRCATAFPCAAAASVFTAANSTCHARGPASRPATPTTSIILLASAYQESHPELPVVIVTRDAAMRCKARARGVAAEDYYSDRPVMSPEKFYSGRVRIDLPYEQAGLLSSLHVDQRLPVAELADFTDVSQLLVNQCCELRVNGNGKAAWGIFKQHDGVGYLRRVNLKNGDRFGPCNPEQACARELMLDDQTLIVSLVGIAGTGKTLMALLSAFELYRAGRVSKIEVYRLNAEAGRQLGFLPGTLGDKMAPWAKPIVDNLDFIIRRLSGTNRFSNQVGEQHGERRDGASSPSVEDLLARNVLEIAPINYLRGALHPRRRRDRRRRAEPDAGGHEAGADASGRGHPRVPDGRSGSDRPHGNRRPVQRARAGGRALQGGADVRTPDHEGRRAVANRGARRDPVELGRPSTPERVVARGRFAQPGPAAISGNRAHRRCIAISEEVT